MIRATTLACAAMALVSATPPAAGTENRCGIRTNPTPANWWLTDRDGEWTIGVQGGYQAEGLETLPEALFEGGWVRTNGYYGYRCACLSVETDRTSMRVTRVHGGKGLPMKRCDGDRALQTALGR
jgi:hypothetical protein